MAVTPIDPSAGAGGGTPEAKFNAAVDNAQGGADDPEFTEALISQAIVIGGQFILVPKMMEIFNESMSSDDEE